MYKLRNEGRVDRYSEIPGYASFQWNKLFNLLENGFFCLFCCYSEFNSRVPCQDWWGKFCILDSQVALTKSHLKRQRKLGLGNSMLRHGQYTSIDLCKKKIPLRNIYKLLQHGFWHFNFLTASIQPYYTLNNSWKHERQYYVIFSTRNYKPLHWMFRTLA